jgi:hypothetical protein
MTLSDFKTQLKDDLSSDQNVDNFYTDAYLTRKINDANKWATSRYPWAENEEAYKFAPDLNGTTTIEGETGKPQEWYDYPADYITDQMTRAVVQNDPEWRKTNYKEYMDYRYNNPTGTDKIWTDYNRQVFFNPNALPSTGDLTNAIVVWGHKIATPLTLTTDVTYFYSNDGVEQSMYKKALAQCYKKGRGSMFDRGVALEQEAENDLAVCYQKYRRSQASYESKDGVVMLPIQIIQRGRGYTNPNNPFGLQG